MPEFTNLYTQLELNLNLLLNDAAWLNRLEDPKLISKCLNETIVKWSLWLQEWNTKYIEEHDRNILLRMKLILEELKAQNTHLLE